MSHVCANYGLTISAMQLGSYTNWRLEPHILSINSFREELIFQTVSELTNHLKNAVSG